MDIKEILEKIGNTKLIQAYSKNDFGAFDQIVSKLYDKARQKQDKKEYFLAALIEFRKNNLQNIDNYISDYRERNAQELALKMANETEINSNNSLVRHATKNFIYENAYKANLN